MALYDLNVSFFDSNLLSFAHQLGYTGVAINTIYHKLIDITPESSLACNIPSTSSSKLSLVPSCALYSRVTLVLDDSTPLHAITPQHAMLKKFDLFAVQPTTEKTFAFSCLQMEGVDVISVDLTKKLPFMMKAQLIRGAIARGIVFELNVKAMFESQARRNVISNALTMSRFSNGKGFIITSGASSKVEMKSGLDMMNLCRLFDLNPVQCRSAVSSLCESALLHGETRKTMKATIRVIKHTIDNDKESNRQKKIKSNKTSLEISNSLQ